METERRKYLNPFAIERVDEYRHRYFRRWQMLTVTLDDYDMVRSFGSLRRDIGSGEPLSKADEELIKSAYEDYGAFSLDERKRLDMIQLQGVSPSEMKSARRLTGTGRIEEKRSIRAFSAEMPDGRPQSDYDRSFDRIDIGLRATNNQDHIGSLFVWTTDMPSWGRVPRDRNEDYLTADIAVREDLLENLFSEIAECDPRPPLTINLEALLYQDEVEASLSELWHPQQFAMLHDKFAHVLLSHVGFAVPNQAHAPEITTCGREANDALNGHVPPPTSPLSDPPNPLGKYLQRITIAIWVLAATVFIVTILR
ncbi:hypothetical protein VSX64_22910 [Aurantimonas sp. C2-6-R+9]|uniref:hypothetical protein n=1 Tax=unclassified Aurantimonas TaxID=2638230 RepID=UPI002E16FF56|nr:hypothetical protein [Aurantimonas sp. C2-6-R+9]